MKSIKLTLALTLTLALFSSQAFAQAGDDNITNYVPEGDIQQQADEAGYGWDGTLGAAANFSFASNSNVVGQVDGSSYLFGVSVIAGLDYLHGNHELRNTLKLSEAWSRTPVLDEMVKSNDILDVEILYNYFLTTWMGPFARLNAETSILATERVTADPTDYIVTYSDGVVSNLSGLDRINLSDSFEPITFNQSVGFFAEPIRTTPFNLSVRIGFGARETMADSVLVEKENDETPEVDLEELQNVYQGGAELFVGATGAILSKRITYDLSAVAMAPFLNNDDEDRGGFDLMRVGIYGGVSFSLAEWMALNYQLKIINDPQLLDEVQVQNNLLLSFQYTLIEREAIELTDEDKAAMALEEEKKKAAQAEEKAKAAEEKAKAAEEKAKAAEEKLKALEAQEAAPEAPEAPAAPANP